MTITHTLAVHNLANRVYQFICLYIHSSIRPPVPPLFRSFFRLFFRLFVRLFFLSFVRSFVCLFFRSAFVRSFVRSFVQFVHSFLTLLDFTFLFTIPTLHCTYQQSCTPYYAMPFLHKIFSRCSHSYRFQCNPCNALGHACHNDVMS